MSHSSSEAALPNTISTQIDSVPSPSPMVYEAFSRLRVAAVYVEKSIHSYKYIYIHSIKINHILFFLSILEL